jgi:small subunit ribosomal protein S3
MAIERKFIEQNMREFKIKNFIHQEISGVGLSEVKVKKTPLGDKIIIYASRPGLVVGRGGSNIQSLNKALKYEFNLENPQIEIEEVKKADLDADIVAERICNSLERFGSARTKGIGHKTITDVMRAGALGVEVLITGKIPSMRARRWRFYAGYLKKAGDISIEGVRTSIKEVTLKTGSIGVQVRIMPPDIVLPDHITLNQQSLTEVETTPTTKDVSKEETSKEASSPVENKEETKKSTKEEPKKQENKETKKQKKSASKKAPKPTKEKEQIKEVKAKSASTDESAADVEDKK